MTDQVEVRIVRPRSAWRDRFRRYKVMLDDEQVAALRNGEEVALMIAPGVHRLRVKVDWTGSKELRFKAKRGRPMRFLVTPARNLAVIAAFSRHRWVDLDEVPWKS